MEFESYLNLGTLLVDGRRNFQITEELLRTHLAIFGGTRYGKSKLMELICRELILNRRGFAFIDPHSDTADDLLGFIYAHTQDFPAFGNKVHYLKPGDRLFSFDPFRYYPDPDDPFQQTETAYRMWLHSKIKDMTKIICRQQGETEDEAQKMVRLRRWLYNALYAVGVRQDAKGTHLPIRDAFILLNPKHTAHGDRYKRVEPFLSDEVRADFEKLRQTKDSRKQEDWVESTFNRLRDILSPTLQLIFNTDRPTMDFVDIIRRGDILLASLGKTRFFHEDEALSVAGLLIREISEAVRTVDRDKRQQFYLFIDEAHNFLGDDLIRLLKESAKYKLSFGLAVQGLDNLQKGDIDMVPAVLGQCGIRITFRQQYHEHAEALAKSLGYPTLDFSELLHDVDRDAGYDWVWTPSVTQGESTTFNLQFGISGSKGEAEGQSAGRGTSETFGESEERSTNWGQTKTDGKSKTHTTGETDVASVSTGRAEMHGSSHGESQQISEGASRSVHSSRDAKGRLHESQQRGENSTVTHGTQGSDHESTTVSRQDGTSHGTSKSVGDTVSESTAVSEGRGESHARSKSSSTSKNSSESKSASSGISGSLGTGFSQSRNKSFSLQLTPLHKTRVEIQRTGQLQVPVDVQFAKNASEISSLDPRVCLIVVAAFKSSFTVRVADVSDPFEELLMSPDWRKLAIAKLKQQIFTRLPYCFEPPNEPPRLEHLDQTTHDPIDGPRSQRDADESRAPII